MMKKQWSILMVMMMVAAPLAALPFAVGETGAPVEVPTFAGGDGSIGNPWQIANVNDLQDMNLDIHAHYALINDIDASDTVNWNSGAGFDPIGWNGGGQFDGSLDGRGFTISDLYINRPGEDYVALIGLTWDGAVIENVNMVGVDFTGYDHCGMLAGSFYANAANVYIRNCSVEGSITATRGVGGLIGGGYLCIIENSYSRGSVTSTSTSNWGVGGFSGRFQSANTITNCYSYASATGGGDTGGFVGYQNGATITNCYSSDTASGTGNVGGFIGRKASGTESSCYWDTDTSGLMTSDGGVGKNTTDMLNNFTFTNAGWDFDNVWFSVNGSTRPFLRMEYDTTIRNSHQLQLMVMDITSDYTIANDIDMDITNPASMWGTSIAGGEGFYPIYDATLTVPMSNYLGVFDGAGHNITGLYINRSTTNQNGLFGFVRPGSVFKNLDLVDVNITGQDDTGGLVGLNMGGVIYVSDVTVTGTVVGNSDTGGLVGEANVIIDNCHSDVSISGTDNVGGLIGMNLGYIGNSSSYGHVSGNDYVGGFTGYSTGDSNINNCSSFGNVDGHYYVAGITGWTDVNTIFNDTHSFGTVTGNWYVGGLIGRAAGGSGTISNSTSSVNVIGTSPYVAGLVGMSYHDISDSIAYGDVNGGSSTGGLVGRSDGILTNCMAHGNVTGITDSIGGLIGNANAGSITDCMAYGNVEGDNQVGGLIGSGRISITDCEAHGDINGTGDDVGGLMGRYTDTNAVIGCDSYGNVTVDRGNNVGGLIGYNTGTVDDCHADSYVMNEGNNTGGLIGYNNGPVSNSTSLGDVFNPMTINFNIYSTGGLIGEMGGSTVSFCEAYGDVTGNKFFTGGLIGHIAIGATVLNCSAYGFTKGAGNTIGGLVGRNEGSIINCSAHGDTGDTKSWTGGLVGENYNGLIQNSSAYGDVFGNSITGGLVGENEGTIERCFSTGDVITTSDRVGGFVGWNNGNSGNGDIIDCYSQGDITGGDDDGIGGFVGNHSSGASMTNVYSTGLVTGIINTGGLVAVNWISTVTDSYWDVETSGQATSINGTGHDTYDMMQQATFTNWDFTNVWGIHEYLTYPFLQAIEPTFVFSADLELTLVPAPSNAVVGDPVIYYVDITNNGPCNALNVNVTLMGEGNGMDYVDNNQTSSTVWWGAGLSWEIDYLGAGKTAWMQVNLTASESGIFYLNGTSVSDIADPDTNNNDVSSNVTMNAPPVATDDSETVDEDSGVNTINVLENDNDAEGHDLTITDITQGSHGTVAIIDSGKNVTYEPDADWNGEDSFNYTISDGNGGTDTATVTVTVTNVNDAPTITTTDITTATEDVLYSVDYDATDIDPSDTLTWSLETDAGWLSIVTATGVLSGTPTNDDVGTFWVNVTVDDGNGGIDWTNFTLTVTNTNDAPVISTTTASDGTEGLTYSSQVNATDIDGDTLTWSLTTNATWLTINSTGVMSGTPTSAGTFWANVTADDGNGGTDSVNLTLVIASSGGTTTPTDTDGDGVPDDEDAFPDDPTETTDTDDDGTGDNADAFPTDPAASVDTDGDGKPDDWNPGYTADDSTTGLEEDLDDDNDGILDVDDDNPLTPDDTDADTGGSNTWLYIIIILVIVGVIGAVLVLRPKGPKPVAEGPVEEMPPEPEAPTDAPDGDLKELEV